MALQTPFFKREPETFGLRQNLVPAAPAPTAAHKPSALPVDPAPAASPLHSAAEIQPPPKGSTLTVGPNIKLKGVEITDCDTLVVEGFVEATMDSRLMQITADGSFKGSADVAIAEIRGSFDGDLTVRDKLLVHATGKVTGKVRYGKLVVEEGGQLSGDITYGATQQATPAHA